MCALLNHAQVIASEGERAAAVNRSEAQRCQFINNSEGERQATVNFAEGKAQQIVLEAQGRAQVVNMAATAQKTAIEMFVSAGLSPAEASRLSVALRYVDMLPSVLAVTAPTPCHVSPFCGTLTSPALRPPKRASCRPEFTMPTIPSSTPLFRFSTVPWATRRKDKAKLNTRSRSYTIACGISEMIYFVVCVALL